MRVPAYQCAAFQQRVDESGHLRLSGVSAHRVQVRQISVPIAAQRLHRKRQRQRGRLQRARGVVPSQHSDRCPDRRAVDQCHAFFGAELNTRDAGGGHRCRPVHQLPIVIRLAVCACVGLFVRQGRAQHQRQMRQRRQVTGRTE